MDAYSHSSDEEADDDLARVRESMKKGADSAGAGLERTSELEEWWNDVKVQTRSDSPTAAATSTSGPSRQQEKTHPSSQRSSFSFKSLQQRVSPGVRREVPPMSTVCGRGETPTLSQPAPSDTELLASTSQAVPPTKDDDDEKDECVWNDASIWEELDRQIFRVSGLESEDTAKTFDTQNLEGTSLSKPDAPRDKGATEEYFFQEGILTVNSLPSQPPANSSVIEKTATDLSSMNKSTLCKSGSQASDSTSDASFGKKTQAKHQLLEQKNRGRAFNESPIPCTLNRTSNDDSSVSDSSTASSGSSLSSSLSEFRRKNGLRSTTLRQKVSAGNVRRDDDSDESSNDENIAVESCLDTRRNGSPSSSSDSDSVSSDASTPRPRRQHVQQLTFARTTNSTDENSTSPVACCEARRLRGKASNEGSQGAFWTGTDLSPLVNPSPTPTPTPTQGIRHVVDRPESTVQSSRHGESLDNAASVCSGPVGNNAGVQTAAGEAKDDSSIFQDDLVRLQHQERERPFTLSNVFGLDDADPQYEVDYDNRERNVNMSAERRSLGSGETCMSEIDPVLFAPQAYQVRPRPIVHAFTIQNRPRTQRRRISVGDLFPDLNLWSTKFDTFNELQSEIANTLAYSDDNLVVSAPTGAGKTAIFEMAMARFFTVDLHNIRQVRALCRQPQISRHRKIVYMAPSKALCEERFNDWSMRLRSLNLGIQVSLITGDGDPGDAFRDLSASHLVVTTPEKFDSLSRRWPETFYLFASIKLYLVDEAHMVADEGRGSCLESVLCRTRTIQRAASQVRVTSQELATSSFDGTTPEAVNSVMRRIAVSATLPNTSDLAALLDANEAYSFDASYRPVPLTVHVIGQGFVGEESNQQFRFWSGLNRHVAEILVRFSNNKPAIVFCHSKADAEKLADLLANANGICQIGNGNQAVASQAKITKLQRVLFRGVAYHHAGLEIEDRRVVERAFSQGKIRALCATSTLAMGVNLPAHLVVIKGTKVWRGPGSGYQDLESASLLQMIGRAGRPGFDTEGTAVIMTDNKSKAVFQRLASSGLKSAKSQLVKKLDEVLNTEISQGVITSLESAMNWMKGTLYFEQLKSDLDREPHVQELCRSTIERLGEIGALQLSNHDYSVVPLAAGRIMCQNLVEFQAMEIIVQLPFDATQKDLLTALSTIEGLQRPLRRSEKQCLNELHKALKYKLEGPLSKARVQSPEQKAFVLLQASIGRLHLEDYSLRQEMQSMVEYASRMLSAIEEYSVKGSLHGQVALQSLRLRRSFAASLWCGKDGALHQLKGLGAKSIANLKFHGITTFDDIMNATTDLLEKVAQRPQPFGRNLQDVVGKILGSSLKLTAKLEYAAESTTPSRVVCDLQPKLDRQDTPRQRPTPDSTVTYSVLAFTDLPGSCLYYKSDVTGGQTIEFDAPPSFGKITVVMVASLAGLDEKVELGVRHCEGKKLADDCIQGTKSNLGRSRKVRNVGSSLVIKSSQKPTSERHSHHIQLAPPTAQPSRLPVQALASKGQATNMTEKEFVVTPSPQGMATTSTLNDSGRAADNPSHATNPSPALNVRIFQNSEARREWGYPQTGVTDAPPSSSPSRDRHFGGFSSESERTPPQRLTMNPGSWVKENRHQQRSQQRAFATRKDNPFNRFKHDPNDSEAQLEHLSSKSPTASNDSIIPPERLRMLDDAYRLNNPQSNRQEQFHGHCSTRRAARRQVGPNSIVAGRQLLLLKAAEMNTNGPIVLPPGHSPSIGYSSTSLQCPFSAVPSTTRFQSILAGEVDSFCYAEPRNGMRQSQLFGYGGRETPDRFYGRYNQPVPSAEVTGPSTWKGNVQSVPGSGIDDDIHDNHFGAFDF